MTFKGACLAAGVALTVCTAWLFVGVFRDCEFAEPHLFLKHRPTFKFEFHCPGGEADRSTIPGHEGYVSPEEEPEERAYIDFVVVHGGYRRSVYWPLLD
jgi:hypothetical protein